MKVIGLDGVERPSVAALAAEYGCSRPAFAPYVAYDYATDVWRQTGAPTQQGRRGGQRGRKVRPEARLMHEERRRYGTPWKELAERYGYASERTAQNAVYNLHRNGDGASPRS
jgi:hypothetical protein